MSSVSPRNGSWIGASEVEQFKIVGRYARSSRHDYLDQVSGQSALRGSKMELNSIKPADGSKRDRRRVGRGIGSGLGKTAGRGHKGQKSRAGGYHKVGFEGGQMPMQRRLPKRGFKSQLLKFYAEVTLSALDKLNATDIDMLVLKQAGLVKENAKVIKIIKTGQITRGLKLTGISASAGAKAAIVAAGGSIE